MNGLKQEIDQARERVAHLRIKAERPGSRLEDEFALEKARTRLLTLELRLLKRGQEAQSSERRPSGTAPKVIRTNSEQVFRSARERAEAAFAALRKGDREAASGPSKKGGA